MMLTRRGFFGGVLAAISTRFLPTPKPVPIRERTCVVLPTAYVENPAMYADLRAYAQGLIRRDVA